MKSVSKINCKIKKPTVELHEEVLLFRCRHDDENLVRFRQVQILLTNSISTDGNIPLRLFVHDVSILLMTLASFRLPCSSGEVQQTEVDLLPGRCFQRPMLRLGSASELDWIELDRCIGSSVTDTRHDRSCCTTGIQTSFTVVCI